MPKKPRLTIEVDHPLRDKCINNNEPVKGY